jgi:hypothetical protein
MSASVVTPSRFESAHISAKLRNLAPALNEYRRLVQAQFVHAASFANRDEMMEFGQELAAYDRWRAFDLGRDSQPRTERLEVTL